MVQVDVLGPIRISVDGRALDDLRPTGRALIADLALAAGRVVSAEQLIDDLWGTDLPANPKGALRVAVSRARKLIGGDATIEWEYGGYRLDGAEVDAVRFDTLVADGRQALADARPEAAAALLADALALWCGEALADVRSAPFAGMHAARLEAERIAVLEQRVEADLACGRHLELVGELAGLVSEYPLQERLWAHRMVALYRAGRQADALRVYGEVRSLLAEKLGLEPGHALRALEESILLQRAELDFVATTPARPVSDAFALPAERPPAPLSGLVGRKAELDALLETVDRVRLVTLVGPAGVGKTRLAVETIARHQDRDAAEVWLVELGLVTDAASVGEAIAMRTGSAPSTHGDALRAVAARLQERRGLLVLDNCEHVRAGVAAAVDQLLVTCRQLTILATSRIPLVIDGEEVVRLAPLSVTDAVALFETRSGLSSDQAGAAMTAICEAVDGLPLAVELAAGLTRTLTVEQVAERIGDRFRLLTVAPPAALPHHQTLRAALEWGHDLLGDDDRALYRRLAVFAGGWTLDAAEAVCADDVLVRGSVAPSLARLVDASLVVIAEIVGDRRFTMLDTMGHFAAEQLDAAGETDPLRARHLDWCRALAERADDGEADELEREFANVRLALESSVGTDRASRAAELLLTVQRAWLMHGHLDDARRLLLLLAEDESLSDVVRAALYGHAGNHCLHAGRLREAERALDLGLPFARAGKDSFILAENRYFRGIVHIQRARVEPARDAFTEVLAIMRRLDRQSGISATLDCLADVADLRGDHATAVRHREAAEALDRARGDDEALATGLARRAIGAVYAGDLVEATVAADEAVAIAQRASSSMLTAWAMEAVGRLATARGDIDGARAAHDAALTVYAEIGTEHDRGAVHLDLAAGAYDSGEFATAARELAEGLPALVDAGVDRFVADGLDVAAAIVAAAGDDDLAVQIAGATAAFRDGEGVVPSAAAQTRFERWAGAARHRLGDVWATQWRAAGDFTLAEIAALALHSVT